MKTKKLASLRYNMLLYFIMFSILIIAIVWIFQILLFDSIYQRRKYATLIETGDLLSSQLNTDSAITEEALNNWLVTAVDANEAGIFSYLAYYDANNVLVVETIYSGFIKSDKSVAYNDSFTDGVVKMSSINQAGQTSKSNIFDKTDNISAVDEMQIINDALDNLSRAANDKKVCYKFSPQSDEIFYIYATTIENEIFSGFLVLRSSQQSLVDTVNIIQTQLIIVTCFVIVVCFFISWYISTKLSKPIAEISRTATNWARGDDTAVFTGESYQELSELADTLNFAKDGVSQSGTLQRDLLANVSHDLKTPLTMIKAYAEMIRDLSGDIKEKREAHTNIIIDEVDRLAMLVNDILDLSKLQNRTSQLSIDNVNLSELCETVIYRFKGFVERSGYQIEKSIEENIYIDCDVKRIEQVIYNLIENSINYTGENKKIFVKLSNTDEGILFESVDSGNGISEDKIKTIWEKYYRFSETHQRPIKGTGLGLSIVKTILETHRFRFGVISKKNIGSNFFIWFSEKRLQNE